MYKNQAVFNHKNMNVYFRNHTSLKTTFSPPEPSPNWNPVLVSSLIGNPSKYPLDHLYPQLSPEGTQTPTFPLVANPHSMIFMPMLKTAITGVWGGRR